MSMASYMSSYGVKWKWKPTFCFRERQLLQAARLRIGVIQWLWVLGKGSPRGNFFLLMGEGGTVHGEYEAISHS